MRHVQILLQSVLLLPPGDHIIHHVPHCLRLSQQQLFIGWIEYLINHWYRRVALEYIADASFLRECLMEFLDQCDIVQNILDADGDSGQQSQIITTTMSISSYYSGSPTNVPNPIVQNLEIISKTCCNLPQLFSFLSKELAQRGMIASDAPQEKEGSTASRPLQCSLSEGKYQSDKKQWRK